MTRLKDGVCTTGSNYPTAERELTILNTKVPEAAAALSQQVVAAVQHLRGEDLFKPPGIAETIDWTRALIALDRAELDQAGFEATLGVVLKYQDDIVRVRERRESGALQAAQAAVS